jgi:glycosyltransferase involved in cell wall biosynthesis
VPELPADEDPVSHYLREGSDRGLDPHPLFSTSWYRDRHPEAASTNPLVHFLRAEPADGLDGSPLVDRAFYFHQYPDVAALGLDPVLHWATFGAPEGRAPHPLLDPAWYVEQHPEAGSAGIPALVHYLLEGAALGHDPSPLLSARWYSDRYLKGTAEEPVPPLLHAVTVGAARDLDPNPLADARWYRKRYPEVTASGLTPLCHYLVVGAAKGYDPGPAFETAWYLQAYADVADLGVNPLVHFLVDGDYQGREPTAGHDPVPRLLGPDGGWFKRQLARASQHEPLLATTTALGLRDHSLATRAPRSTARDMLRTLLSSLDQAPERIVLVPALPLGGAERVAANFANAAVELFPDESVLVMATDADTDLSRQWFDERVQVRFLHSDRRLDLMKRATALARFVDAMRPRAVLNVNSHAGWDMLERHGLALAQQTSLSAALFCRDYSAEGVLGGYADRYFRTTFAVLDALYSDHRAFVTELCDTYGVPARERHRLAPIYQPVDVPPRPVAGRRTGDAPVVLWAGRLTHQKRPDLLVEVARLLPDVRFLVYGAPDLRHRDWSHDLPPNVYHRGGFALADELPLDEADLYLYTSAWDGLPNMLLEVVARGVPVVATNTGGIPELVSADTGAAVPPSADRLAAAVRAALADPDASSQRAAAARDVVASRHSWAAFRDAVAASPFGCATGKARQET